MQKKALPRPAEVSIPAQNWTSLVPGQPVRVQDYDGQNFVAIIEMKTGNSHAVWVIRDDTRTRHVIGNTEGVELLPIDQTAHPHPRAEVQAPPAVDGLTIQNGAPSLRAAESLPSARSSQAEPVRDAANA